MFVLTENNYKNAERAEYLTDQALLPPKIQHQLRNGYRFRSH
jgi:hypothetical protein